MRTKNTNELPYNTIDIAGARLDSINYHIFVAIDRSTEVVGGFGIRRDPSEALSDCFRDAVRTKDWTVAAGLASAVCVDNGLRDAKFTALASDLQCTVYYRPLAQSLAERRLAGLARHLACLTPKKKIVERQLYCDAVKWAQISNSQPTHGLTPEDAWRRATIEMANIHLPESWCNGPNLIRRRVVCDNAIEVEGRIYANRRLSLVAARFEGRLLVDVMSFPNDDSCVWVMNCGAGAFPIFKRRLSRAARLFSLHESTQRDTALLYRIHATQQLSALTGS